LATVFSCDMIRAMAGTTLEFDPEVLVVDAVRQGDRAAFEEFLRRHDRWVRGVVFGVLGDRNRIDDVSQQVWASVWQRIGELRDSRVWKSWLYRLARNAAIDAGRELTRQRRREQSASGDSTRTRNEAAADEAYGRREDQEMVLKAVEALPALYREPFVLRHLQQWNYEQIAELLNMPVDTVETRLVRARRLLRESLKGKVA
jgi:RNA polymerase sigma-70 factor (ECF subfamily)